MKKLVLAEVIITLAGTLFAWTNFGLEMYNYVCEIEGSFTCNPSLVNPIYTPCFYGAIVFTISFIVSILIYRKLKSVKFSPEPQRVLGKEGKEGKDGQAEL